VGLVLAAVVQAGDLPYTLAIAPTGDARIDGAVADASQLARFRERVPVGPFALIARAEADAGRIDDVLRSFGHYDGVVGIRIAGRALGDPALLPWLETHPGRGPVPVEVTIDAGPLYRIDTARLDGAVPERAQAALNLRAGEPALAREILAAGEAVLQALQEDGHALARVPPPDALVKHASRTMDVVYTAVPGPWLALGEVSVTGLERLREDYVRRRLGIAPGEPFSLSRLDRARRDLLVHGVLAWARLTPGDAPDEEGRLPLALEVAERPPRVVRFGAAYSSDDGGALSASWTHRNLFGGAEQFSLEGEIGRLTQNAREDLSYLVHASLRLPDFRVRDLDLLLDARAVSESLDAYAREALIATVGLDRRLSDTLSASAGVSFEDARITQDDVRSDFPLWSLPLTARYDTTDDPLDPTRGVRLLAQATPARVVAGDGGGFAVARLTATGYRIFASGDRAGGQEPATATMVPAESSQSPGGLGRSVLAGRLAVGTIQGAAVDEVPPDWRFYSGGWGSVRGYPFQSLGPRTPSNRPAGGVGLLEAAVELRQRLAGNWGAALFVDAGAVGTDGVPGLDELSFGVGIGLRYATPIGPVRVDLATPLDRRSGDAAVQLTIGIGQAF
jgi:translocation and assembly module TamA